VDAVAVDGGREAGGERGGEAHAGAARRLFAEGRDAEGARDGAVVLRDELVDGHARDEVGEGRVEVDLRRRRRAEAGARRSPEGQRRAEAEAAGDLRVERAAEVAVALVAEGAAEERRARQP